MDGEAGHWLYDDRFGQPVIKDGCGVFGVIRKKGSPGILSSIAIDGISCVKYRGSNLGAGYAAFRMDGAETGPTHKVRAFARNDSVASSIKAELGKIGEVSDEVYAATRDDRFRFSLWSASLSLFENNLVALQRQVDRINSTLLSSSKIDGRIISYGRFVDVYKEVGYPLEVAKHYGLDRMREPADLWLAHTRQPTNSPGSFPIWSHPFASMDCAIVHNGDISSFGSNMELLSSWGAGSHVGTDSEVIVRLLDQLLRVEGISVTDAVTVLTNPYQRGLSRDTIELLARYRGARLDGPFAAVAGYCDGSDTYLMALTDRSKFRPLVIGEDDSRIFVASEENQIRVHSRDAAVWTPEPGSFFIASVNRGIVRPASRRSRSVPHAILKESLSRPSADIRWLDASSLGFKEINTEIASAFAQGKRGVAFKNIYGQRYVGIGCSTALNGARHPFKVILQGYPGNCVANLNDGFDFEIFGNVADDLADTMHDGSVVIHGSVRDVACQALQGGHVFIRGSAGNRLAIQMREYRHKKPFIVVGETADDYLGEYMAGGVVAVLNLSGSEKAVLNYVGTGMVGGAIYIRGNVEDSQIGLQPQREDILNYVKTEMVDGNISQRTYEKIAASEFPSVSLLSQHLPPEILLRVRSLFFSSKYVKPVEVRRGRLGPSDLELLSRLKDFFDIFNLPQSLLTEVLSSDFTVIKPREEKKAQTPPPQEVPVEE